jgi:hypothetical protein
MEKPATFPLLKRRITRLGSVLWVLLLCSCSTVGFTPKESAGMGRNPSSQPDTGRVSEREYGSLSSVQKKVVEGAESFLGKDRLVVRGREFPMDCSGFVMAAYYYAGIDMQRRITSYSGNGVARIYKLLEDYGLLHVKKDPLPGDIVFWDNTYDRNEDGKWNDYFTHTGIVLRASQWGTIEYAHVNYRRGIIIERMNLKENQTHSKEINGEDVIINSFMRMRGEPGGGGNLSSDLFRSFGMGYKLD